MGGNGKKIQSGSIRHFSSAETGVNEDERNQTIMEECNSKGGSRSCDVLID